MAAHYARINFIHLAPQLDIRNIDCHLEHVLQISPSLMKHGLDIPKRVKLEAIMHMTPNISYPLMVLLSALMLPVMIIRFYMGVFEMLFLDLPLIDCPDEVRVGNRVARGPRRAALEDAVEQRQQQDDDDPQGSVTIERVHRISIRRWGCNKDGARKARRKRKMQPE